MPRNQRAYGHSIRVSAEFFERIEKLQKLVVKQGWQVMGVESEQQPTLSAVVEQSVVLAERAVKQ